MRIYVGGRPHHALKGCTMELDGWLNGLMTGWNRGSWYQNESNDGAVWWDGGYSGGFDILIWLPRW